MSIGSCTSCSPVIDAVKLSANPKADANGDGKITSVELQNSTLLEKSVEDKSVDGKDGLKTDGIDKIDTSVQAQKQNTVSGQNLTQLAEATNTDSVQDARRAAASYNSATNL